MRQISMETLWRRMWSRRRGGSGSKASPTPWPILRAPATSTAFVMCPLRSASGDRRPVDDLVSFGGPVERL